MYRIDVIIYCVSSHVVGELTGLGSKGRNRVTAATIVAYTTLTGNDIVERFLMSLCGPARGGAPGLVANEGHVAPALIVGYGAMDGLRKSEPVF
jgi:hypothetical protein